jgi:hypothetical protein
MSWRSNPSTNLASLGIMFACMHAYVLLEQSLAPTDFLHAHNYHSFALLVLHIIWLFYCRTLNHSMSSCAPPPQTNLYTLLKFANHVYFCTHTCIQCHTEMPNLNPFAKPICYQIPFLYEYFSLSICHYHFLLATNKSHSAEGLAPLVFILCFIGQLECIMGSGSQVLNSF